MLPDKEFGPWNPGIESQVQRRATAGVGRRSGYTSVAKVAMRRLVVSRDLQGVWVFYPTSGASRFRDFLVTESRRTCRYQLDQAGHSLTSFCILLVARLPHTTGLHPINDVLGPFIA